MWNCCYNLKEIYEFWLIYFKLWASLEAQLVKNLPAMRETWVRSLGWEDRLEKGRLPTPVFWPGEFHGLYSSWVTKSRTRQSNFHTHFKLCSYSKCIYLNFVFLLKGNCFTILCWFLPYISMNRPWVYTSVPSSWSFLPSSIPFPPPRLSQCTEVNSL